SSQAESISAWCAVFDWPSIVAAFSVCRHGPARSSDARSSTAARSCHGGGDRALHLRLAALVHRGQDVRAVVRLDGVERVAGAHLLAADHERDLELLRLELGQPDAQVF